MVSLVALAEALKRQTHANTWDGHFFFKCPSHHLSTIILKADLERGKKTQQPRYHCCSSLVFRLLPHRPPHPHCFHAASSLPAPVHLASSPRLAEAQRTVPVIYATEEKPLGCQTRRTRRTAVAGRSGAGAESFIGRLRSRGFQAPQVEGDPASYTGMGICHPFPACTSCVLVRLVDVAEEISR